MYKPVLSMKSNHFGSNFWDCFSHKINRDVHFYSDLEYEHWILVETNPDIEFFCEQPLKIKEEFEGEIHESIFDMWIKWKDGNEEFIEIKYEKDITQSSHNKSKRNKRIRTQLGIQKKWCKNNHANYRIVTEKEIRIQPLLTNRKMLLPYLRSSKPLNEIVAHSILKLLTPHDMSVKELIIHTKKDSHTINVTLFHLYLSNKIHIDFHTTVFSIGSKVGIKDA